jgi:hypothetical protein
MHLLRSEAAFKLFGKPAQKWQRDFNVLITRAKVNGLGKPINWQEIEFGDQDIAILKKAGRWWGYFLSHESPHWRTSRMTEIILDLIIRLIINNKPLFIYAIFCPGYKKGRGAFGFKTYVGGTTIRGIKALSKLTNQTKKLNIPHHLPEAWYSDLLLENYEKVVKFGELKNLEKNFNSFKKETSNIDKSIKVKKLSEVGSMEKLIKPEGLQKGPARLPKKILERVYTRNLLFYRDVLGWSEKDTKKRTDVLARCYPVMGEEIRRLYPNSLMVFTENAYERGAMYSSMEIDKNPVPIFYPRKNED